MHEVVKESEMPEYKGLRVDTYRYKHDCTLNGVTSRHDSFVLVDPSLDPIFTADERCPALIVMRDKTYLGGYLYAVPAEILERKEWPMFGGNFVYSSDSRYSRGVAPFPIPVHDRVER